LVFFFAQKYIALPFLLFFPSSAGGDDFLHAMDLTPFFGSIQEFSLALTFFFFPLAEIYSKWPMLLSGDPVVFF